MGNILQFLMFAHMKTGKELNVLAQIDAINKRPGDFEVLKYIQ